MTQATIADPHGLEDAATVAVSVLEGDYSVCISGRVDLGVEQAEQVAAAILERVAFIREQGPAPRASGRTRGHLRIV